MKIYELEVSNYKSLEIYSPIRFSNLNLFIGENDSGKTAVLEAIQVLFDHSKIKYVDFYTPGKEIKIKARLSEIRKDFLIYKMHLLNPDWDFDVVPPVVMRFNFEEEGLNLLKNYCFYEDLKQFYLEYMENFTITLEKVFRIESNKIICKKGTYFSYAIKQSKYIYKLLQNKEFMNLMDMSVKDINARMENFKPRSNEEPDQDNFISELEYNFDLDSIIYRIAKLINSNLYSSCSWKLHEGLADINPSAINLDLLDNKTSSTTLDIDGIGLEEKYTPYLNYFSASELNCDQICQLLYNDQFEAILNLDKTINDPKLSQDIYVFLNSKIKEYLLERVNSSSDGQGYFNAVKENFISLLNKLNLNKNLALDFNFSLKKLENIGNSLEPTLKIISLERGREIDISNKSQGYLRKLLICDFLLEVQNIGSENENGKILLIEEPEIHMHINAQKEIISLLKESLAESDNQVFITTHSHTMIEGMDLKDVYVFRKDPLSGITDIKNLKQIGIFDGEEIEDALISSMGVSNTDLLFLKKVILLVEGEHDKAFIKGLCERPEIAIDTEKILFKHTIGQASIFYYAGLGEFLNLKTIIFYDNHELNHKDKERLKNNPYISDMLKNNIFKIEVFDKPDILDYFDYEYVADYKHIPKEKLPQKNQVITMKEFLKKNNKKLDTGDIEYLAREMGKIPKELTDKVINFLKLQLMIFSK